MKQLNLKLRNCYGIKSLDAQFDFSEDATYAVYAPNGSMKSSLANTFADVAEERPSADRIFKNRETVRNITDESGDGIPPEAVLVLPPYVEMFGDNEKTSTLLVDAKLRKRHEEIHREVDRAKAALLTALRKQAGIRDVEAEVSRTFTADEDSFLLALNRIKDEVRALKEAPLADVPYKVLFDAKVREFLSTKDVQAAVAEYIETYNRLIEASTYFRRGVFDYHNAAAVAKALANNGFFEARHSLSLNAEERREITNEKELAEVIQREREEILEDAQLRQRFGAFEKLIGQNANLRAFQAFLAENENILPKLGNVQRLQEEVWQSFLKVHEALFDEALARHEEAQRELKEIETEAGRQRTQWEAVIDIFNERFYVPFELKALNRVRAILGEAVLNLGFVFKDGEEAADVGRSDLLAVLSAGERKALYILNVLFEVEVRKKSGQETLFVVDDIADSFDYKNKYAIIEYLKDIAAEDGFRLILLTHNFDFFRTVQSRFVRYNRCLMATRTETGLSLEQATGIQNIFVRDWKLHLYDHPRKRLASIPFVRNLVEYTRGEDDPRFELLTSLLHWKGTSMGVSQAQLDEVFAHTFSDGGGQWNAPDESVLQRIMDEADLCLADPQGAHLENKIVLAMAIRIVAERYMAANIEDDGFIQGITGNQTGRLFGRIRADGKLPPEVIQTLDRVVLMTPENIHLNSFMYEPILDMSDQHLRQLYQDVKSLPS